MKQEILADLEEMFKEAKLRGWWFHCNYQDLWFSPSELRRNHQEGRFVWGKANWTLRDPQDYIKQLKAERDGISRQIDKVIARIKNG